MSKTCNLCKDASNFRDSAFSAIFVILLFILATCFASKIYIKYKNSDHSDWAILVKRLTDGCYIVIERYAKVLYTTYQIISGTELTLGVVYPSPFAEATQALKITELSFITIIPFDCIYPNYSYYNTFLIYVLSPLVCIILLLVNYFTMSMYITKIKFVEKDSMPIRQKKNVEKQKKKALRNLKDRNIGFALLLTYFVLPSVSTTLFSMYNCDLLYSETCNYNNCPYKGLDGWPLSDIYPEVEGDICGPEVENGLYSCERKKKKYLRNDYSIVCMKENGAAPRKYFIFTRVLAPLFIIIYPFGIPMIYTLVLYYYRRFLNPQHQDESLVQKDRKVNKYLKKIQFLWYDYHPRYYWFEVVESIRRLLLTGVLVTIESTFRRVIMGFALALLSFVLYREARPFVWMDTNLLAAVCQMQLIVTFFMCLLIQTEEFSSEPAKIGTFLLISNMSAIGLVFILQIKEFRNALSKDIMMQAANEKVLSLKNDTREMQIELHKLLDRHLEKEELSDLRKLTERAHTFRKDFSKSRSRDKSRKRTLRRISSSRFAERDASPRKLAIDNLKKNAKDVRNEDDVEGVGEEEDEEEDEDDEDDEMTARPRRNTVNVAHLRDKLKKARLHWWKAARCISERRDESMVSFEDFWYPCYVINLAYIEDLAAETGLDDDDLSLMNHELALGNIEVKEKRALVTKLRKELSRLRQETALDEKLKTKSYEKLEAAKTILKTKEAEYKSHWKELELLEDTKSECILDVLDVSAEPSGDTAFPIPQRCIYISHEWSLPDSPDDGLKTKLKWIQNIRKHLNLEERPSKPAHNSNQRRGIQALQNKKKTYTGFKEAERKISESRKHDDEDPFEGQYWVWMDVFSLPRKEKDPTSYMCALMSLPYYIGSCSMFIPLLRDPQHWKRLYEEGGEGEGCKSYASADSERGVLGANTLARTYDEELQGSYDTFWKQGFNRLEILIALCPKMFKGHVWRTGPVNLRYRMHEDPTDSGLGPIISMHQLKNPLEEDARYRCCEVFANSPLHDCDKPVVAKIIHSVAEQFNDYARSGSTEWSATALISTKAEKDQRPQWLLDATKEEYLERHLDFEAKLRDAIEEHENPLFHPIRRRRSSLLSETFQRTLATLQNNNETAENELHQQEWQSSIRYKIRSALHSTVQSNIDGSEEFDVESGNPDGVRFSQELTHDERKSEDDRASLDIQLETLFPRASYESSDQDEYRISSLVTTDNPLLQNARHHGIGTRRILDKEEAKLSSEYSTFQEENRRVAALSHDVVPIQENNLHKEIDNEIEVEQCFTTRNNRAVSRSSEVEMLEEAMDAVTQIPCVSISNAQQHLRLDDKETALRSSIEDEELSVVEVIENNSNEAGDRDASKMAPSSSRQSFLQQFVLHRTPSTQKLNAKPLKEEGMKRVYNQMRDQEVANVAAYRNSREKEMQVAAKRGSVLRQMQLGVGESRDAQEMTMWKDARDRGAADVEAQKHARYKELQQVAKRTSILKEEFLSGNKKSSFVFRKAGNVGGRGNLQKLNEKGGVAGGKGRSATQKIPRDNKGAHVSSEVQDRDDASMISPLHRTENLRQQRRLSRTSEVMQRLSKRGSSSGQNDSPVASSERDVNNATSMDIDIQKPENQSTLGNNDKIKEELIEIGQSLLNDDSSVRVESNTIDEELPESSVSEAQEMTDSESRPSLTTRRSSIWGLIEQRSINTYCVDATGRTRKDSSHQSEVTISPQINRQDDEESATSEKEEILQRGPLPQNREKDNGMQYKSGSEALSPKGTPRQSQEKDSDVSHTSEDETSMQKEKPLQSQGNDGGVAHISEDEVPSQTRRRSPPTKSLFGRQSIWDSL